MSLLDSAHNETLLSHSETFHYELFAKEARVLAPRLRCATIS